MTVISSNAKMAIASPSAGAVMLTQTARTAVMRRNVTVVVRNTCLFSPGCLSKRVVLKTWMHLAADLMYRSFLFLFCQHRLSVGRLCPQDEFQCNNTLCKPLGWRCDGEDDCGDNSDENPEDCGENHCVSNVDGIPEDHLL